MIKTEEKLEAFPILEPLSKATATALAPVKLLETDFLEIDVCESKVGKADMNFLAKAVCLKRCPKNLLPSVDAAADPKYVQTEDGAFYKDDAYYNYPSFAAASTWFHRVPERKQEGYATWVLAGTDYSALIIHHAWPHRRLIFKTEEAQLLYTFLLQRFYVQTKAARIIADFKLNKTVPEMPQDYVAHSKLPLVDFQRVGLMASLHNPSYALFMEQGTGKTAICIARVCLEAARKRARTGKMYRVLVICPQQVRLNWRREFKRFATAPGKTCVLRGGRLKMVRTLTDAVRPEKDCAWSATMLSIDSVVGMWEALKNIRWDLVIIDESHKIKNAKTNRFKALMQMDSMRAQAKMILTGTPITNTIFDLWAQFEWLGEGLSGFSTFENYRSFHGKFKDAKKIGNGVGVRKLAGFKNIPLVQERLARLSFLLSQKESGMKLPERVYDIYEVAMAPAQMKIYKDVANQVVAEISEMLANSEAKGQNITAECMLVKMIRLAQVCSGFVKLDDIEDLDNSIIIPGETHQISNDNPKIDAIVDIIRQDWANDPNSKCIIWASFIEDIRAISERLAHEGIRHVGYHDDIQKEYRVKGSDAAEDVLNLDDGCRVLVANPASGGVGQNFLGYDREHPENSAMYVDHHVYFSSNWSAVDRSQSEKRSHRRGTRRNLRITDLVIPFSIDLEIRDRVKDKRAMAMSIQDIRSILNGVLKGYK